MFKFCGFDMDGTFINSLGDIAAAMNRSLVKMGYHPYKVDEYRQMVGNGMRVLCERAMPDKDPQKLETLVSLYNKDYLENCCVLTAPYDGMLELAETLKNNNIYCAILSNKPHTQTVQIASSVIPDKTFDCILGQTDDFPPKPSPKSLFYLMDRFNVSPSETVYIGDSDVDIKLGKEAGVYTIGVSWGFRGEEELKNAGADIVAHNAEELKNILLKHQ